jgi:hypothetical protein
MLITYFREFPIFLRVGEPPYGRWLARSFVSPLAEEHWLKSPGWRTLVGGLVWQTSPTHSQCGHLQGKHQPRVNVVSLLRQQSFHP